MPNFRSMHAFGSEANIDIAIQSGLIDAFDVLFLDEGKIGWIKQDGQKFILEDKKLVSTDGSLPEVGDPEVLYVYDKRLFAWDGTSYYEVSEADSKIEVAKMNAIETANEYTDTKIASLYKAEDAEANAKKHTDALANGAVKTNTDNIEIIQGKVTDIQISVQQVNDAAVGAQSDIDKLEEKAASMEAEHGDLEALTTEDKSNLVNAINWLNNIDYTKLEFDVTEIVSRAHIYGVVWNRSDTASLARTDESAAFKSPVVAVDSVAGSSPFDTLMPWAGMQKITDENNQVLVSIPKFWYKWTSTDDALMLQIADSAVDGFYVSPMHADRGDGNGERDVAYIGRYQLTNFGSTSGQTPVVNASITDIRNVIATQENYFQQDFASWWTIRMLFLVEHASWDGQAILGEGNISGSIVNTGATDTLTYHTGMVTANNADAAGNQYRWIENPWSNVGEWIDGITFDGTDIYVFNNPAQMSNDITAEGAVKLSYQREYSDGGAFGWIQDFGIPDNAGLEYALYPTTLAPVEDESPHYVQDACGASPGGSVLISGGVCVSSPFYGPFLCSVEYGPSEAGSSVGSRLQKLP